MKVCLVSKEVGGISGGGIGIYIVEAGRALAAHGHEVWLLTADPGPEKMDRLRCLEPFHRVLVAGDGVPADRRPHMFHGAPHYAYSSLVHETLVAAGETFDYIEFPDYEAEGLIPIRHQQIFGAYERTLLGIMLHSPTSECFRFDQQGHRTSLAIREVCLLEDDAIRAAPALSSPSRGLYDLVAARLGLGLTDRSIVRYPMRLSDTPPPPPRPRQSLDELQFLYFGRIEPRKGVAELVEGFRRLPRLRLRLVGGDVPYSPYGTSFRAHLERRAPSNVEFLGQLPRDQMLQLIGRSDVCILPSLFENWPNACIEAMAAARVVIGSRHGGMAEMIEDGESGLLVDGRDVDDIVRVITVSLQAALPRLDRLGTNAAARIRALSSQDVYVQAVRDRIDTWQSRRAAPVPVRQPAPRVSVVIPFYNDRDTVDEAVQSACDQRYSNVEILLVDDGSPLPDADAILQRQVNRDSRVRLIRKKNGGLSSARNEGVRHATGDYVIFLDADNILRPDYASAGVRALEPRPDRMFAVPEARFFYGPTGHEIGIYNPIPFDRSIGLLINRFGDAGAMFRRSLFLDHDIWYDEVLVAYEDWALWMDLAARGLSGVEIPRVLYDYRVRPESMVRQVGVSNHAALMGLLIDRHFPVVDPRERDVLVPLFQLAGDAINVMMGGKPDPAEQRLERRVRRFGERLLGRARRVGAPVVGAVRAVASRAGLRRG